MDWNIFLNDNNFLCIHSCISLHFLQCRYRFQRCVYTDSAHMGLNICLNLNQRNNYLHIHMNIL